MAVQRLNVQYIRYYTDGTAARKLEYTAPRPKKIVKPKPHVEKRKKVYVDPVAILGVLVAVCMLIVMAIGITQLQQAQQDAAVMEQYVAQLTKENENLRTEYAQSYDLEAIEKTAIALGMVPSDTVKQTQIQITMPQEAEDPTVWETIGTFLTSLFA